MTIVHFTPFDFKRARIRGLKPMPFEKGLFTGKGSVESAPVQTNKPFDNLVGSFNAEVPNGASVQMDVQVLVGRTWSAWFSLVRWDGSRAYAVIRDSQSSRREDGKGGRSLEPQEDALGRVDIDTLILRKRASAFRYRIRMQGPGAKTPKLVRVAVTCVNSQESLPAGKPFRSGPWVREIRIKPLSQIEEQDKYRHHIKREEPILCSPTSLAMVLEHWGLRKDTLAIAKAAQDRRNHLFGNWPLNVQAAAICGLSGHVARLTGFDELQNEIAQGRPVVASVTIQERDLSAEPKRKTAGHVLVVAGFTPKGDVIVYDPFSVKRSGVRRIYPREEFRKIWLERKLGLAYILGPRFPQEMAVGVPITDLRRKPAKPLRFDSADPDRLSQLPLGQRVRAIGAKGDWVRIEAIEQPHWNGETWQGYPGWVRADALTSGGMMCFGTARRLKARSFRARLNEYAGRSNVPQHIIPPPGSSTAAATSANIKRILQSAERFVGAPYVWGGLSQKGIDCSGVIYLSYRGSGFEVPRDAKDQHRRAAKIRRSKLEPGDLVFLAKPAPEIYHVMLYAGDESLIESREKTGVLKTTFQKRFGKPMSAIESGSLVNNLPGRKPAKVRISFGSLIHH